MAKKKLCSSHIGKLRQVTQQLGYSQTMGGTTLILNEKNRETLREARNLIEEASRKLDSIE